MVHLQIKQFNFLLGAKIGLALFFIFNLLPMPKLQGYQYGSIILLLGSLLYFLSSLFGQQQEAKQEVTCNTWAVGLGCAWVLYASVQMIGAAWYGGLSQSLNDVYPFLLSLPVFFLLRRQGITGTWVYKLNGLGSMVLFVACVAFRLQASPDYDARTLNTLGMMSIQFACLVAAMFAVNIAAFMDSLVKKQSAYSVFFFLAIILSGLLVLFSTARGSWPSLLLIPSLSVLCFYQWLTKKQWMVLFGVSLVLVMGLVSVPQVKQVLWQEGRISEAISDMDALKQGENNTSIGLRFLMWENAVQLIAQKPIAGWGEVGFKQEKKRLALHDEGIKDIANFGHPHNEILNVWVKYGLLGLISLLLVYGVPMAFFCRQFWQVQQPVHRKTLAFAGMAVVVCFMAAGLTQTIFAHNSGRLYYAMVVVIVFALLSGKDSQQVV